MPNRPYEKHVIVNLEPEELAYHGSKMKEAYKILLSNKLIPGVNCYVTIWEASSMPANNPTCSLHAHEVDQISIYIGEKGTFEVTYPMVPPGKSVIDENTAYEEDEYTIRETGLFYIPKGVRHNVKFGKIEKPVIEIGISLGKGSYP